MIKILLVVLFTFQQIHADPQLQSKFQASTESCMASGAIVTVNFSPGFTSVPQVAVGLIDLQYWQNIISTAVEVTARSLNSFSFKCYYSAGLSVLKVRWLAVQDDNIFVDIGSITFPGASLVVQYTKPQAYNPRVGFFINGLDLASTGNIFSTIMSVTTSSVTVVFTVSGTQQISKIYYTIIYGPAALFTCTEYHVPRGTLLTSYTDDPYVGVIYGINEFARDSVTNDQRYTITSSTSPNNQWIGEYLAVGNNFLSSTFTAAFCFYTPPCPSYCTSCSIRGYPYCDACVAGTQRLLSANCLSCPDPMYASNAFSNCQQCMPVCDSCTTGTTCTVCSALSLRINPSTICNQCPPQMFVKANTLICQQCLGYCI